MDNSSRKRAASRGSSFTSCLLSVVIFFGSIGFYYFNYYRWGKLEEPLAGLEIAKVRDPAIKAQFKKRAVSDIIDPGLHMVKRLSQIRKDAKKGAPAYPEMEQEITEVKIRLLEIMDTAKLRLIPKVHAKQFKWALQGLGQAYQSTLVLEEYLEEESEEQRKKILNQSRLLSSGKTKKSAKTLFNRARAYYRPTKDL